MCDTRIRYIGFVANKSNGTTARETFLPSYIGRGKENVCFSRSNQYLRDLNSDTGKFVEAILLVFLFEYLLPNRACILNFIAIKEGESIHNYLFLAFPKKKNTTKNTEKTNKQKRQKPMEY